MPVGNRRGLSRPGWTPAYSKQPGPRQWTIGLRRRWPTARLREPLHDSERGVALETWMLHEIRAHLANTGVGGALSYSRTSAGVEVDFVWTAPRRAVGIEVKATRRWRRDDGNALRELNERRVIQTAVAVYGGEHAQQDGPVTVLPVPEFLRRLPDPIA